MIDDIVAGELSSLLSELAICIALSDVRKSCERAVAGPGVSIRGSVAEGFTVIRRTGGQLHDHPEGTAYEKYGPAGEPLMIIHCKEPGKLDTIECLPA